MNYDELRDYINSRDIADFLELANDKKSYVCPQCGNGTRKKNAEGLKKIPDSKNNSGHSIYKCFSSSCGFSGDILAIYSAIKGYKDLKGENYFRCLDDFASDYNITIEKEEFKPLSISSKRYKKPITPPIAVKDIEADERVKSFEANLKSIDDSAPEIIKEYFIKRGISSDDISLFNLKYYSNSKSFYIVWKNEAGGYIARDIKATERKDRYRNIGEAGIVVNISEKENLAGFNTIWITEGLFDSLSLSRFNLNTIALNSTSNYNKIADYIVQNKELFSGKNLIISLDNDEAGIKASEDLKELLEDKLSENRISLAIDIINLCEGTDYKDINEFLADNLTGLAGKVENSIYHKIINPADINKFGSYNDKQLELDLEGYRNRIATGIDTIDELLGGGLCNGLYIIGAGSSMGKTVLLTQIMEYLGKENIAIYISLEQGKFEIFGNGLRRNSYVEHFKSFWSEENRKSYSSKFPYYSVIEGDYNYTLAKIKSALNYYSELNTEGKRIILGVDYLQALRTGDKNLDYNDKARIDKVISELKILSSSYKIPIIALASFNREAYNKIPSFSSFKESGAIEYTGDVVLTLYPSKLADIQKEAKSEASGTEGEYYKTVLNKKINKVLENDEREIIIEKLKNRFGKMIGKGELCFRTPYAFFSSIKRIKGKKSDTPKADKNE